MDKVQSELAGTEHQEIDSPTDLDTEPYGPPGMSFEPCSLLTANNHSLQPGFRGIAASRYVALCASFSAIGGLLFGYECVSSSLLSRWVGLTLLQSGRHFRHPRDARISRPVRASIRHSIWGWVLQGSHDCDDYPWRFHRYTITAQPSR